MKNPWFLYILVRLGMFFGIFAIFALLEFNIYFAAIIAATVSFALSTIFLDRQRNQLSEVIHKKLGRDKTGSYPDAESDLENQILDASGEEPKTKP